MKCLSAALLTLMLVLSACTRNHNETNEPYSADASVGPGAEKELCFTATKDTELIFRFESDQTMSFNFHYHVDDTTYYPVPDHMTKAEKGQYLVPKDETYCMNWINIADVTASLTARVEGARDFVWY